MGRGAKAVPSPADAKAAAPAAEASPAPTPPPPPAVEEAAPAPAATPAPAPATACAGAKHVCWGCGAVQPPPPAKAFQTCARCREDGLEPSPFCSKECLKANWSRHKAWHAEQKSSSGGLSPTGSNNAKEKAVLSTLKNVLKEQPASEGKSYMGLLMQADELKLKGSYSKAEALLNEALEMQPENPVGFAALGEIRALLNQPAEAAKHYAKAMTLFPKKTEGAAANSRKLWASSTLSAIFWLNVPQKEGGLPVEEHPEWFHDVELKELTATLVALAPDDLRSWQTRAFVLCPMPDMPPQWQVPSGGMMRSEAELQEAGRCWQKVMEMTPGGREAKRPYVARAAHCFRTAQMVAAQLQQNAINEGGGAPEPPQPPPTPPKLETPAANEAVPAW